MLSKIGESRWTREDMISKLEEFATLYAQRPVSDNNGGMSSTHMFLFWYVLQFLKPKAVIESGVWRGQGTWLIEQACPHADIYCIDINWNNLVYRSERAQYLSTDFTKNDWSHLPKEETIVFFDDHIDAVARCEASSRFGFRHIIFEDNYFPSHVSDFYTLKLAFAHAGYKAPHDLRSIAGRIIGTRSDITVKPNADDEGRLREIIDVYEELPPVFKIPQTRWNIPWDDKMPTPEPLLTDVREPYQQLYLDEAKWYTWMCYVRLKRSVSSALPD